MEELSIKIIKEKISTFTQKYYLNEMLRGVLLSLGIISLALLLIIIPESIFYFPTTARKILFFLLTISTGIVVFLYILRPLSHLLRLRKGLSYEEAAIIIGNHFSDVNDKLLNLLQLEELTQTIDKKHTDLILASIEQKSQLLMPFNFKSTISYRINLSLLKWILPSVIILICGFLFYPSMFKNSINRVILYNQEFNKPLSYTLSLVNDSLTVKQNQSFTFIVEATGKKIPERVFLMADNHKYVMAGKDSLYTFTLDHLHKDIRFSIETDLYKSQEYTLNVIPIPAITQFEIEISAPQYTGIKPQISSNNGSFIAPKGSSVKWRLYTKDVSQISMFFSDTTFNILPEDVYSNVYTASKKIFNGENYSILPRNNYFINQDTIQHKIQIKMDEYPQISVEEYHDSLSFFMRYFSGEIIDDYGFSSLHMVIKQNEKILQNIPIEISDFNRQNFFFSYDFKLLKQPKKSTDLSYYFEVMDNDVVSGYKSSQSKTFLFHIPDSREMLSQTEKKSDSIQNQISKEFERAQRLKESIKELKEKSLSPNRSSWKDKQFLNELINEFESIDQEIQNIKHEMEKQRLLEEDMNLAEESIMEKQKMIEELMDEVFDEEMKKLMEELRDLLNDYDNDKLDQLMKKIEDNTQNIEMQLDRQLEMFKNLKFEKLLQQSIDQLEDLHKKEEDLINKADSTKQSAFDQLAPEQEQIEKEAHELENLFNKIDSLNRQLERPKEVDTPKKSLQEAEKDMQEAQEQMMNKEPSKSKKSMKKAKENLKSMLDNLSMQMMNMKMEDNAEDVNALKQILENLIDLSFEQERLIKLFQTINLNDPKYVTLISDQYKLKVDLEMVKDSIVSIGKRQPKIKPHVTKSIDNITRKTEESIKNLNDRYVRQANIHQQFVMTEINNLALLLIESLNELEDDMDSMGLGCPSEGNSKKKKKSAPSMSDLKKMQQKLLDQMTEMKQNGEKGENKEGQKKMNEQLARMAAQQSAIRKKMEEYRNAQKESKGKGDKSLQELIDEMDRSENQILNKNITQDLVRKQKEILTRLLKHEKADREQEQEEKREAEQAKTKKKSQPNVLKYKKITEDNIELLKTVSPAFKDQYRKLIIDYFQTKE